MADGPSTDAWLGFADVLGLTVVKVDAPPHMCRGWAQVEDWIVTMDVYETIGPTHSSVDVHLRSVLQNPRVRFRIREAGALAKVGRRLGVLNDLSMEHETFDNRFQVEATRPDVLREILGDATTLLAESGWRLTFQVNDNWPDPEGETDPLDELVLRLQGYATTPTAPTVLRAVRPFWENFQRIVLEVAGHTTGRDPDNLEWLIDRLRFTQGGTRERDLIEVWNGDRIRQGAARALFESKHLYALAALATEGPDDDDPEIAGLGYAALLGLLSETKGVEAAAEVIPMLALGVTGQPTVGRAVASTLETWHLGEISDAFTAAITDRGMEEDRLRGLLYAPSLRQAFLSVVQAALDGAGPDIPSHAVANAGWALAALRCVDALFLLQRARQMLVRSGYRTRLSEQDTPVLDAAIATLEELRQLPRSAEADDEIVGQLPRSVSRDVAHQMRLPRSLQPEEDDGQA